MCIEIVIIYISSYVSSMFLIDVFQKKQYVGLSLAYVLLDPGTRRASVCTVGCVCPDVYTICSLCHRGTRLGGLSGPDEGTSPPAGFLRGLTREGGRKKEKEEKEKKKKNGYEILDHIIQKFIQHFPNFLMFRMFKDAKMTGEMLVYFCTVKTQGPVSLRKKKFGIKLKNKQKPN